MRKLYFLDLALAVFLDFTLAVFLHFDPCVFLDATTIIRRIGNSIY